MITVAGAMPTWFDLHRHDGDGATPPADPGLANGPTTPPADPEDDAAEKLLAAALGDAGKRALAEERAARKAAEKSLAEREAKLRASSNAQKSEAEKLADRADAAEKRADAATTRAVRAEVKAAASEFADPTDAVALLGDLGRYAQGGDINSDAIATDLAALLEAKPHLRKAAAGPRNPAPDPSQGRGGNNTTADYRTADKSAFDAELAKYGLRPRS